MTSRIKTEATEIRLRVSWGREDPFVDIHIPFGDALELFSRLLADRGMNIGVEIKELSEAELVVYYDYFIGIEDEDIDRDAAPPWADGAYYGYYYRFTPAGDDNHWWLRNGVAYSLLAETALSTAISSPWIASDGTKELIERAKAARDAYAAKNALIAQHRTVPGRPLP